MNYKVNEMLKTISNNSILFSFSLTVVLCLLIFYKTTAENKYEIFIGVFLLCFGFSYMRDLYRDDLSKNNALISSIQETTTSGDFDLLDRVQIKKNQNE